MKDRLLFRFPSDTLSDFKHLLVIVFALLLPGVSRAIPYASGVTVTGGNVSFMLNEAADSVMVVLDGGANTLNLGPLNKGPQSFSLGGASSFKIVVNKSAAPTWTLISSDTNTLLQFNSPRGVAVNLNAHSSLFGRIYVANSASGSTTSGRAVGDGIYVLNADQSDALGRGNNASTGGLTFNSGGGQANNPWHIEVGPENFLYIADFSTNTGNIYRTDPDVSVGINVLEFFGITNQTVHTTIGSSPIVQGSLDTSDLTVWAIDGRFPGAQNLNRLMRWDIGAGPLPYASPPTNLATPLINTVADVTTDLDRGPDGKFYMMQNRSAGNESGIVVVDADGTTILWRSLTESRSISNNAAAVDILRISRGVKISPDGTKMAIIRDDLQTWIIPLINGIPDLINRQEVTTYSGTPTTSGRDVCFDAAGNLYALNSGNQLLRIFSSGGVTAATTGSDGTFSVTKLVLPRITLTVSDALAGESGPDPGEFTLTRSGDTSSPLTVNYTLTGTATNGIDYATNQLSVTFAAGVSSTNIVITPIDDSEAELTESVVLTLTSSATYELVNPVSGTVNILDNERPALTLSTIDGMAYEPIASDTMTFKLTRLGDTNLEIFFAEVVFTGTAVPGVDFASSQADVSAFGFAIPPGVVTTNVILIPQDNADYQGERTIIASIAQGSGEYDIGAPGSGNATIRDDESPPASVLFSDDFESDSSGSWISLFGANNGNYDAQTTFAFDYSTMSIPPAPHSAGTTKGLFIAVNKTNNNSSTTGGSAGINLYPLGQSFSGDYALRFDMFLSFGTSSTTEHAILGLNHSGQKTNRVTQSTDTNNTTAGGDGIWAAIVTDASDLRDYAAYTSTNPASLPYLITNRSASTLTGFITSPPYAFGGSPGNNPTSTKTWSAVELSQVGNVVSLKVNNALIWQFTNTYGFTSGNIMIGHNDQFDSVGPAANFVIFDNVRVVSLSLRISNAQLISGNRIQIDFTSPLGGVASDMHLQSTSTLSPSAWADDNNAVITAASNGFRAVTSRTGNSRYYRIRR